MKKLLLVVFALVALNPRVMPCDACVGRLPQAVISCSTGLQAHWGKLLMSGNSRGLFGVFTQEAAVDATLSGTLNNMGPLGSGLSDSAMRSMTRTMLSKPCG